jgi:hypothetical protein
MCGIAILLAGAWNTVVAQETLSEIAFKQLTGLVGEWKGVQGGTQVRVVYTLTARDTVLMEEFRPEKGPTMVTMFSVDGDHLIATHYCSARNQPHMATAALAEPHAKTLAFSLTNVTGMKSRHDWHNTGLVIKLQDNDHLTQEWTYQENNTSGTNVFHYSRVR